MTDLHSIPVKDFVFKNIKLKATCRTCGRARVIEAAFSIFFPFKKTAEYDGSFLTYPIRAKLRTRFWLVEIASPTIDQQWEAARTMYRYPSILVRRVRPRIVASRSGT